VKLNLAKVPNSITDYFIICHGNSRSQVEAIADSVEAEVKKATGANPWHKEGYENAEWILIDYFDVVVHIFLEESRGFYKLEKLWADAERVDVPSSN
jgi:ribosome-associated protein